MGAAQKITRGIMAAPPYQSVFCTVKFGKYSCSNFRESLCWINKKVVELLDLSSESKEAKREGAKHPILGIVFLELLFHFFLSSLRSWDASPRQVKFGKLLQSFTYCPFLSSCLSVWIAFHCIVELIVNLDLSRLTGGCGSRISILVLCCFADSSIY